jgi:hypothetical protein
MERTTIFGIGKYTSIVVMLLTALITAITAYSSTLDGLDWGRLVIAFGVFLVALRNYIKDKYGIL